ncbi:MAG: heat shock protein Hsp20 [Chlamydiales bacterium]|nr:heat shock protein Hsp20 [Chlamydiales bacterium]
MQKKWMVTPDFDHLVSGLFPEFKLIPAWNGQKERPMPCDVYEEDKQIVVQVSVPGIKREQIDIALEQNKFLRIRIEELQEKEAEGKNYYHREIVKGSFERSIKLPVEVDPNHTEADYQEGILTIKLPKREGSEQHKIRLKQ